jgi:hypothetical protein
MSSAPTYKATLELFELLSGSPADTHWRALLRIATASDAAWTLFEPFLEMEQRRVEMEEIEQALPGLNLIQARLVGLALHFYQGYGAVDMAALAEGLDTQHWEAVLEALEIYRAGFVEH